LVIKIFYKNNGSSTATVRELSTRLGRNVAPNESSVRRLVKKFETTGFVLNLKNTGRQRSVLTDENIAIAHDSVIVSPS